MIYCPLSKMETTNFNTFTKAFVKNSNGTIALLNIIPASSMQENMNPMTLCAIQSVENPLKRLQKRVTFADASNQSLMLETGSANELAKALFLDDNSGLIQSFNNDSSKSKTNLMDESFSAINIVKPNILKKREKDPHFPEPIKNLPFSPSRFLNPNSTNADRDNVSKDLNLSLSNPIDDSGIETSTCDSDALFAQALTSTPISKKSHKPFLAPLKTHCDIVSPLKPIFHETCISEANASVFKHNNVTSNDSGNETVFKTPLIRKYLNESVLRTPTPFKCDSDSNQVNDHYNSELGLSFDNINENYDNMSPPRLRKTPSGNSSRYFDAKSNTGHTRPLKKARKALLLDQDWSCHEPLIRSSNFHKDDISPLATKLPDPKPEPLGFIPFGSPLNKSKIRVHNRSNLVDNNTVVECTTYNIGRRSFYTKHSETNLKKDDVCLKWKNSIEQNKKWVSVACGCSEDQKAMTIAARKYLRKSSTNITTLSNAVLIKESVLNGSLI